MTKLDESRHSSICGMGTGQYYRQDGKLFDVVTKEEVDLTTIEVKAKSAITCRFCNAKRETAEMMQEHLIAKHSFQIKQAKAKEESANPETPKKKSLRLKRHRKKSRTRPK